MDFRGLFFFFKEQLPSHLQGRRTKEVSFVILEAATQCDLDLWGLPTHTPFSFFLFIYLLCIYVCDSLLEVEGQLSGVSFSFGSWELNSGHQAWMQAPSFTHRAILLSPKLPLSGYYLLSTFPPLLESASSQEPTCPLCRHRTSPKVWRCLTSDTLENNASPCGLRSSSVRHEKLAPWSPLLASTVNVISLGSLGCPSTGWRLSISSPRSSTAESWVRGAPPSTWQHRVRSLPTCCQAGRWPNSTRSGNAAGKRGWGSCKLYCYRQTHACLKTSVSPKHAPPLKQPGMQRASGKAREEVRSVCTRIVNHSQQQ